MSISAETKKLEDFIASCTDEIEPKGVIDSVEAAEAYYERLKIRAAHLRNIPSVSSVIARNTELFSALNDALRRETELGLQVSKLQAELAFLSQTNALHTKEIGKARAERNFAINELQTDRINFAQARKEFEFMAKAFHAVFFNGRIS